MAIKSTDKLLVVDLSNLMHRYFWFNINADGDDLMGLVLEGTIGAITNYYNAYKPDNIIVAFDSSSWRKLYTEKSKKRITNKQYKGHRKLNLTPSEKRKLKLLESCVDIFYNLLTDCTTIITMKEDLLEADDLIAGVVQLYENNKIVIISADKDFTQLLRKNVTLINPLKDVEVTCDDVEYFLFEKCIRGDVGDNVQSAYPRIRSTKIKEAFVDPFVKTNIMKHTWKDPDDNTYLVEDLFKENKLLMDLTCQPSYIREIIELTVTQEVNKTRKFDMFKLCKILNLHNLNISKANILRYVPTFNL